MLQAEHSEILFNPGSAACGCTLKWVLLERGVFPIEAAQSFTHDHPAFNRIFCFVKGGAQVRFRAGSVLDLKVGNVYLLPVDAGFQVDYEGGSELVFFHLSLLDPVGVDLFEPIRECVALEDEGNLFREIVLMPNPEADPMRWQTALFQATCRLAAPYMEELRRRFGVADRYNELMQFIQQECRADLTVGELANRMRMSRAALSKGFQRATGVPLKTHLSRVLLRRARTLLAQTDDNVKTIASELGFADAAYFRRVFRQETGYTPIDYRRQAHTIGTGDSSGTRKPQRAPDGDSATASATSRPSHAAMTGGKAPRPATGFAPFATPSGQLSGDTFPIFRDGTCHLFHMMPPVIAHHVSHDLVEWEPRPVAVHPGAPGEPDCNSLATGCVVEHQGRFYLFYTGNQNVCLATSPDLDHWTRHPGNPVLQADNHVYDAANFRDPFVFYNEPEKTWWMLFGTRVSEAPGQRAGCVGLAKSNDLLTWQLFPPLWAPGIGPHCDCPQLLRDAGRWWLLYLQRNTRYRTAADAAGPFARPRARNLGTPLASAASRPAFDGKRWVSFPFIARCKGASDRGEREYGGPLAVPRHLDFHSDGTLTERPVDEVIDIVRRLPDPGDPLVNARPLAGTWRMEPRSAQATHGSGGTLLLAALPSDFYLEFDLTLRKRDCDFHLLLRASADLVHGYQFAIHYRTGQLSLRPLSLYDDETALVSRSFHAPADKPLNVKVFLAGSILEIFVGGQAALTSRVYNHREGQTALEFRDGTGMLANLAWRPLAGEERNAPCQ